MFALIEKETNRIDRIGTEYYALSDAKPFYWVECPDDCNPDWTFDGETFTAPVYPPPNYDDIRKQDYQNESDPIFFKWQRGEATQQEWLDKIAEIKARYPEE